MRKSTVFLALLFAFCFPLGALFFCSCGGAEQAPGAASAPGWLSGHPTIAELLDSVEGLNDLSLAGWREGMLLAGRRGGHRGEAGSLFAVRADTAGRVSGRWLLGRLSRGEELVSLKALSGEGGFCVAALIERLPSGEEVRYWFFSEKGKPAEGTASARQLSPFGEGEIAVNDLQLLSAGGGYFIFYRLNLFDPGSGSRSALMMKRLDVRVGAKPVVLEKFAGEGVWEITAAASAGGHFALLVSRESAEGYSSELWAVDEKGKKLGPPALLYIAKNLFEAKLIWEPEAGRWVLLRGTPLRYWFQTVPFRGGRLGTAAAEPVEIRFGATLVSFRRSGSGYLVVLRGSRRLLSSHLGAGGALVGTDRELVGRQATGNRVLHVLSAAWVGECLAAILFFGESSVFRLLEP